MLLPDPFCLSPPASGALSPASPFEPDTTMVNKDQLWTDASSNGAHDGIDETAPVRYIDVTASPASGGAREWMDEPPKRTSSGHSNACSAQGLGLRLDTHGLPGTSGIYYGSSRLPTPAPKSAVRAFESDGLHAPRLSIRLSGTGLGEWTGGFTVQRDTRSASPEARLEPPLSIRGSGGFDEDGAWASAGEGRYSDLSFHFTDAHQRRSDATATTCSSLLHRASREISSQSKESVAGQASGGGSTPTPTVQLPIASPVSTVQTTFPVPETAPNASAVANHRRGSAGSIHTMSKILHRLSSSRWSRALSSSESADSFGLVSDGPYSSANSYQSHGDQEGEWACLVDKSADWERSIFTDSAKQGSLNASPTKVSPSRSSNAKPKATCLSPATVTSSSTDKLSSAFSASPKSQPSCRSSSPRTPGRATKRLAKLFKGQRNPSVFDLESPGDDRHVALRASVNGHSPKDRPSIPFPRQSRRQESFDSRASSGPKRTRRLRSQLSSKSSPFSLPAGAGPASPEPLSLLKSKFSSSRKC